MDSVTDEADGCYVVTTETGSRYWLDLDRRLVRRVTRQTILQTRRLRRDGHDIDLLEIVQCRLGQPMIVLIDLNLPGVWLTTRESTLVVRIDPVPQALVRS
jgi:hypothetical protein